MLAADDFVGALSNKKRILTVIEIILFFTIVFFTVNNRFNIEQLLLNCI